MFQSNDPVSEALKIIDYILWRASLCGALLLYVVFVSAVLVVAKNKQNVVYVDFTVSDSSIQVANEVAPLWLTTTMK